MSRTRYTVVATLHEHDHGPESEWRVTLRDEAGRGAVLHPAQPVGREAPYQAGSLLTLDARLVEAEGAG